MKIKKGAGRLWLMIALMLAGAIAMGSAAIQYITYLQTIDARTEVKVLYGLITLQKQDLSSADQMRLFVLFVVLGVIVGGGVSGWIYNSLVKAKRRIETMSAPEIWASVVGLVSGLLITFLLLSIIKVNALIGAVIAFVICAFSIIAFLHTKEQLAFFSNPGKEGKPAEQRGLLRPKILDTNVIIDGRIADVCKAGFVEGPILIPRFVLEELQQIADSSDPLKRARGRRGLDILNNMQKELEMQVQTVDVEATRVGEDVDSRLVRLAQDMSASVITNDFNLNKVAALQGVQVLNVNELANALKPVVLPGEEMSVLIIKEGKEANQGIGYMDDGTMIVVEGGKRRIGDTLDVIVTSVLQTVAGKMIFANMKAEQANEEESVDRNVRPYYSGRPRKKIR